MYIYIYIDYIKRRTDVFNVSTAATPRIHDRVRIYKSSAQRPGGLQSDVLLLLGSVKRISITMRVRPLPTTVTITFGSRGQRKNRCRFPTRQQESRRCIVYVYVCLCVSKQELNIVARGRRGCASSAGWPNSFDN